MDYDYDFGYGYGWQKGAEQRAETRDTVADYNRQWQRRAALSSLRVVSWITTALPEKRAPKNANTQQQQQQEALPHNTHFLG